MSLLLAIGAGAAAGGDETPAEGGVVLTRLGYFDDPTETATAPGRTSRDLVFVAERAGVIGVIDDSRKVAKPFLDISDRVASGVLEQGLLAIAFDPRYEQNRRFYAYYTTTEGTVEISRFRTSADDPLVADPDSEQTVLEIPHHDSPNHNGGDLAFGPDGNLWITTGDANPACDPPENAQNRDSLLGKLLRIDPRGGGYDVPRGNPFVGAAGADEIYAYGFRNPFRFSIDPRSGTIAIGDVGQFTWEEINLETLADAKGANFGWDAFEGYVPLNLQPPCDADSPTPPPAERIFPVLTYPHASSDPDRYVGCAVIGGTIVRDRRLRDLRGRYLYSDHCNGRLRSFDPGSPPANVAIDDADAGLRVRYPTSIVSGRGGRVYATSRNGQVYRLDPAESGAADRFEP